MEYLLKASAVIVIFYGCYKLLLQRDTFFQSNRWFFLTGLVTAVFIPMVVIPIYVEQTTMPVEPFTFVDNASTNITTSKSMDVLSILNSLYLLGFIVFTIRFILQIISLIPLLTKSERHKSGRHVFIKTRKNILPFSFFSYIVYNPELFNETELEQIIAHEKVHVHQHHTIDVLLAQLACVVFWFNPFIWLYNKDLKQNLEFIADGTAINYTNCKKSYQYTLLKTSMPTYQLTLTNNFYHSLIKKRIVMLHKSKSKKINQLKYVLIVPALALFLMSFNTEKVILEKEPNISATETYENSFIPIDKEITEPPIIEKNVIGKMKQKGGKLEVIITKDFTNSDLDKLKTTFKKEGYTLAIKGVKRNKAGEITAIKIEVSSKSSNANYTANSDDGINPVKISIGKDGKNISIGDGYMKKEKYTVFISKDGNKKAIKETDSDENVFVLSSDEDNTKDVMVKKIVIKDGDSSLVTKDHKIKISRIKSDGNAMILKTDDDKDHKIITVKTIGDDDGDLIWTTEDDENEKFIVMNKDKGNMKVITSDGKSPLYIVDGKEMTSKEMTGKSLDNIETVKVLNGDEAIKKYGDKAKDGVIIITTKKKD